MSVPTPIFTKSRIRHTDVLVSNMDRARLLVELYNDMQSQYSAMVANPSTAYTPLSLLKLVNETGREAIGDNDSLIVFNNLFSTFETLKSEGMINEQLFRFVELFDGLSKKELSQNPSHSFSIKKENKNGIPISFSAGKVGSVELMATFCQYCLSTEEDKTLKAQSILIESINSDVERQFTLVKYNELEKIHFPIHNVSGLPWLARFSETDTMQDLKAIRDYIEEGFKKEADFIEKLPLDSLKPLPEKYMEMEPPPVFIGLSQKGSRISRIFKRLSVLPESICDHLLASCDAISLGYEHPVDEEVWHRFSLEDMSFNPDVSVLMYKNISWGTRVTSFTTIELKRLQFVLHYTGRSSCVFSADKKDWSDLLTLHDGKVQLIPREAIKAQLEQRIEARLTHTIKPTKTAAPTYA